jgi:hypothetical protein
MAFFGRFLAPYLGEQGGIIFRRGALAKAIPAKFNNVIFAAPAYKWGKYLLLRRILVIEKLTTDTLFYS